MTDDMGELNVGRIRSETQVLDELLLREALGVLKMANKLGMKVSESDPFLFALEGADVVVRSRYAITKLEERLK